MCSSDLAGIATMVTALSRAGVAVSTAPVDDALLLIETEHQLR